MSAAPPTFDLTLVCGRRPELLEATLASFAGAFFDRVTLTGVYANIDPFGGTEEDGDTCAALIRARFPDAVIFRPEVAGFAAAVIRLWQATTADIVFHLEDDWLALAPLDPARMVAELQGEVQALTLLTATKNTRNQPFQTARRRVRQADGTEVDLFVNAFSTSPGFFRGPFLRQAAALMRPEFDPEKQFFRQLNPELEAFALPWKCKFLFGPDRAQPFLIEDTGRAWRERQRLGKWLVKGQSIWGPLGDPQ